MTISSTSKSPLSNSQNGEQLSKARRYWRLFYTNISVEPLLFLYGLGFSISQSISPVLYMDKICLVGSPLFGNASQTWDKEICDHMDTGQYPHVQTYVQTVTHHGIDVYFDSRFLCGFPATRAEKTWNNSSTLVKHHNTSLVWKCSIYLQTLKGGLFFPMVCYNLPQHKYQMLGSFYGKRNGQNISWRTKSHWDFYNCNCIFRALQLRLVFQ